MILWKQIDRLNKAIFSSRYVAADYPDVSKILDTAVVQLQIAKKVLTKKALARMDEDNKGRHFEQCMHCGGEPEFSLHGHRGYDGPTIMHDCQKLPGSPRIICTPLEWIKGYDPYGGGPQNRTRWTAGGQR
jgi:hypothetical protein